MLQAFEHQKTTTDFIAKQPYCLVTSDPGTGKTRSVLDAFLNTKKENDRLLVLAPLSILQASWGDDIEKFTPNLTYAIALAANRKKRFNKILI